MAIVAVSGLSFSLRENEPNPCNVRIARELVRIVKKLEHEGHSLVIVVQWEVDAALKALGFVDDDGFWADYHGMDGGWNYYVIGQYDDGRYLGTAEVIDEMVLRLKDYKIDRFVAVANPFIHQPYVYWLARKHYKLLWQRVHRIGFDKQSTQWWCRSWWQLAFQTVRLALGFSHGYNGRQAKA